ncbi:MAG: DNA helicase RecG, partial [Deltaproteobacteria bacterium]|nr:DNA helicase RecG [Deltaproteobacteria bacterium]
MAADTPSIQYVKGVGPRLAERLAARGIRTPRDALFFFPKGYEDRRRIVPIGALVHGMTAPVRGRVLHAGGGGRRGFRGGGPFEVTIADGTGRLTAKWFHAHPSLMERFRAGETILLCGAVRRFRLALEMHHPEILSPADEADPIHLGEIIPVYPEVEGVPPRTLRKIQREVVKGHAPSVREFFPGWMLVAAGVPPIHESIAALHFPPRDADIALLSSFASPQQQRLVFQELFYIQWTLAKRRAGVEKEEAIP